MTLEEKIGQLRLISIGPEMPRELIRKEIAAGNIGGTFNSITRPENRPMQDAAMRSRLKIPMFFAYDVIHGHRTIFPISLALAYAKMGKKVIVLDADLGLANVNVVLGVIPRYNLYHLIRQQKKMRDIILDTSYGIQIVAGASGFSKIANLSEEERKVFIEELQELSNADIIIIDTSAGVSNNVLTFVAASDDVIIVTTPEPTAITDAYGIVKIIATEIDNLDSQCAHIAPGFQEANRVVFYRKELS